MKTKEITKQLITPEIAKEYLELNTFNRKISQPVLLRYVNDMKNGKWKDDTFELIKISKTGRILDGQHRLEAVVKSKCSIYFHIAFNLEENIFDVLDTGKSRNASDCFRIAGVKSSNTIPSIIAHYNLLKSGKKSIAQLNFKSTNAELLNQYYEDVDFWQNVSRKTNNWYHAFAKIITPSFIGGSFAYFYTLNPTKAELFIDQLCTGVNITNNSIYLLRTKLILDKTSPRKLPRMLKIALIIKTWNHFVQGNNVKILKFDTMRDSFPVALNK